VSFTVPVTVLGYEQLAELVAYGVTGGVSVGKVPSKLSRSGSRRASTTSNP
jgi:hypothetical protein